MNEDGEDEILSSLAFPRIGALTAPGGLEFCCHHGDLLTVGRLVGTQVVVSAVCFLQADDVHGSVFLLIFE